MDTLTSRRSALAARLRRLGRDREFRYDAGEMLCDGLLCLREAVSGGAELTAVLAAGDAARDAVSQLIGRAAPVYGAAEEIFDYVSPLKSAQDILFSCKLPQSRAPRATARNLILDGVRDPGNVGTAIRSAAAFGIDSVILTGSCADPYNPKTARASMGAVFHQNVAQTDEEGLCRLTEQGMMLIGAAANGAPGSETASLLESADLTLVSVAVGSEGYGLSRETLALCAGRVAIPMEPMVESLNAGVAASIIMWEMYKRAKA